MTATMICRATADLGSKWLVATGGPGEWNVENAHSNLQLAVEAVTATPFLFPNAQDPALQSRKAPSRLAGDFVFTTRALEDAIASYAGEPDEIANLGLNSLATILCPEGGGVENRWVVLHRVPITGTLVGTGVDGKFRPQCLRERVLEWFTRQQWRSFQVQKVSERHEPIGQQAQRPPWARELLVRHNWAARAIAPDAFLPIRSGPVVTDEQAARRLSKLPASKGTVRRQKQQANHARIRAEAAERARQREAAAR